MQPRWLSNRPPIQGLFSRLLGAKSGPMRVFLHSENLVFLPLLFFGSNFRARILTTYSLRLFTLENAKKNFQKIDIFTKIWHRSWFGRVCQYICCAPQIFKACTRAMLKFIVLSGVIQKPRGHNITHIWPPIYLCGHFLCTKHGQKLQTFDHPPTSYCPCGFWITPPTFCLSFCLPKDRVKMKGKTNIGKSVWSAQIFSW